MSKGFSIGENDQIVHCLVHPGFDAFEHPEFEKNIVNYIHSIASRTRDVLLIVSDGERFYDEQIRQFALLDIIDAISFILSQTVVSPDLPFHRVYVQEGVSREFFDWFLENVDISELIKVEKEQEQLRKKFLDRLNGNLLYWDAEHAEKVKELENKRDEIILGLDIKTIAEKALAEFGPIYQRKNVSRKIQNSGRFFRLYQFAMHVLGPERVREIFIIDNEKTQIAPILPVGLYINENGEEIPSGYYVNNGEFDAVAYNASNESQFGNAAKLRDDITTELSVSRNQNYTSQNLEEILRGMGVDISPETIFLFSGEYRDRCVDNVYRVLEHRFGDKAGDKWTIISDDFTLERPENHISFDWY